MTAGYTVNPLNMSEISPCVITDKESISKMVLTGLKCYFYDACSFRKHANLDDSYMEYFLQYFAKQKSVIIITRGILMELASHSGVLNQEYLNHVKRIYDYGITVLVMYEEDLFHIMEECFSTNTVINEYLCWAVRTIKSPVSTITETLDKDCDIYNEVIKGKNLANSGLYKRFFEAVRANKESGDNLGEELIAICLHILSYLPGEADGKFNIITEDKCAAGKIDMMFKKTAKQYAGKSIGIFSTPKLVQMLFRENILLKREHIKAILSTGTDGNLVVLGMLFYDIRGKELSLSVDELTGLIMQPNGINIFF